ncbi:hypothetical protein Vadar_030625 [Vaccinium darrowii]|uniref:Uncharacterized protein n=1 Tax=Vaccinium darrowii TaxID=229202 RepID=A0ACB7YJ77_9ERIC|nr:hypothetical protein Vadar_030625 [Vaccinium darrowii]
MEWWSFVRNAAPFAALMAAECTDIGMTTLAKAAMIKGMSNFVFVVYANALGALILLPIVLTRSVAQMLESTGVKYSSPTLSSAMSNLNPIFTYVLAISFRMEELDLRSSSTVAKFLGALVSVLGAFILTLYKGQKILSTSPFTESPHQLLQSQKSNWVLAGLLLAIAFLSFALSNIFQTAVVREIPEKTTIVFFLCFFTTTLCGSFSLIVERNLNAWKLRPGIELIAVVYAEKGPVFVAMFKPVGVAIAVVMSSLFLGDPLYLGSVVGAVIIALGFYTVMWGKAKEKKLVPENEISCFESSSERIPLLQNKPKEEM